MKSLPHLSAATLVLAAVLLPAAETTAQNRSSREDRFVARADGSDVYRVRRGYDPLVAEVQSILVQKDIYHHRHHNQVDGIFGEETRHAVEDFQRLSGLPATGMLDSVTLQALGLIDGGESAPAPSAQADPAPAPVPVLDPNEVLTPVDVAKLLRVQEEDVVDLLEAGELAGRKISGSWRILRRAVNDFFLASEAGENHGHDHSHDHDHDTAQTKQAGKR